MKVYVARMTTSREDDTKYEHFVTLKNDKGQTITPHMHYKLQHALTEASEYADFFGVKMEPYIEDGKVIEPEFVFGTYRD